MAVEHRTIPPLSNADAVRFWSKVRISSAADTCWNWQAGLRNRGYGDFYAAGGHLTASRVAYWLATGKDPADMQVCHTCDNPRCCNPAHLFLGTNLDNSRDADRKGRLRVRFGTAHYCAKLTEADVVECRRAYAAGECSRHGLARRHGVTPRVMANALHRKTWKHVA